MKSLLFAVSGSLITGLWLIVAYRIWVEQLPSPFPNGSVTALWVAWFALACLFGGK